MLKGIQYDLKALDCVAWESTKATRAHFEVYCFRILLIYQPKSQLFVKSLLFVYSHLCGGNQLPQIKGNSRFFQFPIRLMLLVVTWDIQMETEESSTITFFCRDRTFPDLGVDLSFMWLCSLFIFIIYYYYFFKFVLFFMRLVLVFRTFPSL